MRTLLKILVSGLLLVLAVAVGAEVVALHHPDAALLAHTRPVVVRKAARAPAPAKLVRSLPLRKRAAQRHHGT